MPDTYLFTKFVWTESKFAKCKNKKGNRDGFPSYH